MRLATFPTPRDLLRGSELAERVRAVRFNPNRAKAATGEDHPMLRRKQVDQFRVVRDQDDLTSLVIDAVAHTSI